MQTSRASRHAARIRMSRGAAQLSRERVGRLGPGGWRRLSVGTRQAEGHLAAGQRNRWRYLAGACGAVARGAR